MKPCVRTELLVIHIQTRPRIAGQVDAVEIGLELEDGLRRDEDPGPPAAPALRRVATRSNDGAPTVVIQTGSDDSGSHQPAVPERPREPLSGEGTGHAVVDRFPGRTVKLDSF